MFLRKYWLPLSVFVVAIVGVGLYMLATRPPPETVKIYKTVKPIEKPTQQPTAEAPVEDTSQGGHFHGDGTFHAEPHEAPVEQPSTDVGETPAPVAPPTPTGSLTYHAELLASDPVEALRQQGKERGHWSADYLPDFPADDTEAMEIARAEYHYIYYGHTIPMSEHGESPEFQRAAAENRRLYDAINERYPIVNSDGSYSAWEVRARNSDLKMLAWPSLEYDSSRIDRYRDYTYPSLLIRSTTYPDLPELGERK